MQARKKVYDSAGVETEVPMGEWVKTGVLAPGENGDELRKPLYVRKHRDDDDNIETVKRERQWN